MKLVIDHLRGTRRGQRQVLDCSEAVGFGRHPSNAVVFDARGDIDASSQHATLHRDGDSFVLLDVGSSNGTWICGEKVQRQVLEIGEAIEVDFGHGGPRVRLWLGEDPKLAPPLERSHRGWRRFLPW